MRLMGALLLAAACTAVGLRQSSALAARVRLLSALLDALEVMRSEISCCVTPMAVVAERLGSQGPEVTRPLFCRLRMLMSGLGEQPFAELWRQAVCSGVLSLRKPEEQLLCSLGQSLGRYSAAEQESAIRRCMSRLEELRRAAEREAEQGRRLYGGLGLAGGLLLAVILI